MAKFPFEVMQECVYPFTAKESKDPDVILGSAFGEDVAVTRVGDDLLLSHVDPIVGAVKTPLDTTIGHASLTGGHKRP